MLPGDEVVGGVSTILKVLAWCTETAVLCELPWIDWWS